MIETSPQPQSNEPRSQEESKQSLLKPVIIKIGDTIVLDKEDELAYFDLEMDIDLLVGLTLLKLGFVATLDQMN